ncbi:MAG: cytochrome c3 family protein [Dehalococcoidia bacterium]|nr:cytochrome c3 family protein [Dehalococcoidia bacterium]
MLSGVRKSVRWLLVLTGALLLIGLYLLLTSHRAFALDETGCLQCHGTPGLSKTGPSGQTISLYVSEARVNTAAHRYIDCTSCHTSKPHETAITLNKQTQAEKCGTCHSYQYKLHAQSIHGQQLRQGVTEVASCLDCHSAENNPHAVIRVLEYSAPTYKKNIAGTCAQCHAQEDLMATFGIVEKVYESYMRSFHGKATALGTYKTTELDKATCTNCHGVHDIKSVSDPSSPVAGMENLTKTCVSCHPGAGPEFVSGFLGHKEASPRYVPAAHYTEILFTTLLISVITFGIIVVLLAVRKYIANRWKETL